jgi:iron complex outermembrane receptor protein
MDFHGGCPNRMDPPTAYVFPEAYDRITVIKGPQTVAYGNGNSAGVVLFENDRDNYQDGVHGDFSAMAGSWDRYDAVAHAVAASSTGYLEGTLTHSEMDDYEDGDGNKVHSSYERQSASLIAGYRIDSNTRIDVDYTVSEGEADYAYSSNDGVLFDRESYGLTFDKSNINSTITNLNARVYHSYIDHVMDNYTRRPDPMMGMFAAMNPDRETDGARASIDLALNDQNALTLGADWRDETHTGRMVMMAASAAAADAYKTKPRVEDYSSEILGMFGELTHTLDPKSRVIGGLRIDNWDGNRPNVASASEDLYAGFARYEQDLEDKPATAYIGLGHNERPMDYWEAKQYGGLTATSTLKPEKTNQLDAGILWKNDQMQGSFSAFYAKVDDYILVRSATSGMTTVNSSENVDTTRYGAEADAAYKLDNNFTLRGSLAYVHADNDTRNVPLAQTPPLEGTLGLDYQTGAWTLGGVVRMVAEQDRIHAGYGTVAGLDEATATPGFTTLALNASYAPDESMRFSFGVDNVFDKTYAEHINQDYVNIAGYLGDDTGARIYEPGRSVWVKANLKF